MSGDGADDSDPAESSPPPADTETAPDTGTDPAAGSDAGSEPDSDTDVASQSDTAAVPTGSSSVLSAVDRLGRLRLAVVGVTVLALLLRLVDLGGRVFHWDEGRVGYWALRFHETGKFFYRPIIHGPFIPVVNNALFDLLPVSDFIARLPVAVLGGLLPLSALLLRDRLSDRETVALALLLAVDPMLLYYGRFMRSDVIVGSFAFAAFALVVAGIDRRNGLYAVPAAASMALAFTAKENALVYVLCLAGAAVLLVDHRLAAVATRTDSLVDAVVDTVIAALRAVDDWTADKRLRRAAARRVDRRGSAVAVHLAVWIPVVVVAAATAALGVLVFFYAPRPDLWQALGGTRPLAPVLETATLGAGERFVDSWVSAGEGNPYLAFAWDLLQTVVYGSGVVAVLGAVGFLADGYGGRNRRIVAFATYWAVVSLLGYPVGTDIQAPWLAVHVVLPLCVPAAVGLVELVETAERALVDDAGLRVGVAVFLLVAAGGGVVVANVDYWNTADEEDRAVIQWAQPENDIQATLATVDRVTRHNDGTDVLYVGTTPPRSDDSQLYVANESALDRAPPAGGWHSRLPLPWYTEGANATVTSTPPSARYDGLPSDPPPVVIAHSWDRENVSARLPATYEAHQHKFKLWGEEIVLFVDGEAVRESRQRTTTVRSETVSTPVEYASRSGT
jgi:uncharacterized protein (TIGR03663 family)